MIIFLTQQPKQPNIHHAGTSKDGPGSHQPTVLQNALGPYQLWVLLRLQIHFVIIFTSLDKKDLP